MLYCPLRVEEKAIFDPSGDQARKELIAASKVNRVRAPRTRSTSQRSQFLDWGPPTVSAKVLPSGESRASQIRPGSPTAPSCFPPASAQTTCAGATEPLWYTRSPYCETENCPRR